MAIFRFRTPTGGMAAGTVVTNVLAGSKFEFLSRPSSVQVFASQDGAGAPGLLIDWSLGNVVVGEDMAPNVTTQAGLVQRLNDGLGAGVGMGGDRIQIRARNTSAAVVNLTLMLDINEI